MKVRSMGNVRKRFLLEYMMSSLLVILVFVTCKNASGSKTIIEPKEYPRNVGEIVYDAEIDSNFILCENLIITVGTHQDEFSTLRDKMLSDYKSIKKKGETGFITLRFMVNCMGETTMFRVQGMDNQLEEREFDERITNELIRLTKESSGWKIININGNDVNYNQYLTFNIVDSELIEIAP